MRYIETNKLKANIQKAEVVSNIINIKSNITIDGYIHTDSLTSSEIINNIKDVDIDGVVNNLDVVGYKYIRLINNNLMAISGFSGGVDGKELCIINNTNHSIILYNDSNNSNEENRIITGLTTTVKDLLIGAGHICQLLYDGLINRWRVVNNGINNNITNGIKIFYHTFYTEEIRNLYLSTQGLYSSPQVITLEYYDGVNKRSLDISNHIINITDEIVTVNTTGLNFTNNQYVLFKAILFTGESININKYKLIIRYSSVFLNDTLLIPGVDYTVDDYTYIINKNELNNVDYISIYYYDGVNKKPLDLSNHISNLDNVFSISIASLDLMGVDPYIEVNFLKVDV